MIRQNKKMLIHSNSYHAKLVMSAPINGFFIVIIFVSFYAKRRAIKPICHTTQKEKAYVSVYCHMYYLSRRQLHVLTLVYSAIH